ncbi:carboxy terminal-processing peptidase [Flavobacterium sp. RSSA_27]|uniref:carboxy terminal-processing peptidase n=1 Tax=Flavobacterium sp. RSSA_27 TaxID=3447667 RepID=UPI003F2B38B5
MKKILLVALVFSSQIWAQNNVDACKILSKINALIQKEHVQPKPVDDSLSVYIFDNLINDLDPGRNVFFTSEYDTLSNKYRLQLDNLIQNQDCEFITTIDVIYQKAILRNKSILEKLDKENLDYSLQDTVRVYKKAFPVYITPSNLEKTWRKKLRFDILTEIAGSSKNLDSIQANFESLINYYKGITIQNEICKINTELKRKNYITEKIFALFCTYFDPHTNYFSANSKSNFVSSLSKERLSLGFMVNLNEKNQIIIEEIDPNGPAFKNGKLKKGDQILSISNTKETLRVTCASMEQISELISSDANKIITLMIKRKGEKNFSVTLEKEVIKDEDNTVYSYVVEGKNKIGYIKIPSFYSNFENKNSSGCAEDVGSEIIKLQNDNINGLVIDLMDNGGGSMEEAIKLAGLFVHHGPISIVVDKTKRQQIIQDSYRGYLYKGPVIILVNNGTASASEFFATILQDYNRAMVIGSSTLGKATMQTILPLENDEDNFVKVTINKFYRITGKSHQSIGVIPDVKIPILYESIMQNESDYPTAFKNDVLTTSINFTPYIKHKLIHHLAKISHRRVQDNSYFNNIVALNKRIDAVVKNPKNTIPLEIKSIFEEQKEMTSITDDITNFKDETLNLKVKNATFNESLLKVYPSQRAIKEEQIKTLKNNHYLNEAIQIINDYFELK